MLKQRAALRGLRQKVDRTREIHRRQVALVLDNNGATLDLTRQADNLGVAVLAKYNHLTTNLLHLLVGALDLTLQCRHHGTRGIDHLDTQLLGSREGRRRLAVGTDKQATTAQTLHIGVGHGLQSELFESLHLDAVVHDVA